jgi:DNA polymerase (family 10)
MADDLPYLLAAAVEVTARVRAALAKAGVNDVELVGDARRGAALASRILVIARADADTVERALHAEAEALEASRVTRKADDVVLRFGAGEIAHVRPVADDAWVATLVRATGSRAHVRWLERRARGKLDGVLARAKSEADVYAALRLPFVPPELREGATPRVPDVVANVRGVFHVHTDWSDGTASIVDMARAAAEAGYAYIGISDHTKAASYANGLDAERLGDQARAVAIARREVPEVTILHGTEVDILDDGALDLDDDVLRALDFVIASVHSRFAMPEAEMTARVVRAVSHPLVTILGHPTGRLLLGRGHCAFDIATVARAAAENDTYLEINANPQRLDLSSDLARTAAEHGAKFAIDPDAHSTRGIADTPLGLTVARRAGLSAAQILNARDRDDLVATLSARKARALGA